MPVIKSAKVIKVDCSTGEATSLEVSCSPCIDSHKFQINLSYT